MKRGSLSNNYKNNKKCILSDLCRPTEFPKIVRVDIVYFSAVTLKNPGPTKATKRRYPNVKNP